MLRQGKADPMSDHFPDLPGGRQQDPREIRVRPMTRQDLARVGEILFDAFTAGAARHGYEPSIRSREQGISWAWAILRHGPKVLLIAEKDDHAVGITCLNPRGKHAGVGPVAVDPVYQGRGVGRQLMNALLERAAGLESVRLFQESFNPASRALYDSFGFVPVAELLDLYRAPGAQTKAEPDDAISKISRKDLQELHAYDIEASRLDRRTDLMYYATWGELFVMRRKSLIRGFLACLPGSGSVQLGPLLAESEEDALRLFRHASSAFCGKPCHTRIMAKDSVFAKGLADLGFQLYSGNMLMVRGSWRPGPAIEAFGGFPEGV